MVKKQNNIKNDEKNQQTQTGIKIWEVKFKTNKYRKKEIKNMTNQSVQLKNSYYLSNLKIFKFLTLQ
jgi:hypothetical protein